MPALEKATSAEYRRIISGMFDVGRWSFARVALVSALWVVLNIALIAARDLHLVPVAEARDRERGYRSGLGRRRAAPPGDSISSPADTGDGDLVRPASISGVALDRLRRLYSRFHLDVARAFQAERPTLSSRFRATALSKTRPLRFVAARIRRTVRR
jgi:hypothetical protein